jgi:hypothetical protein
VLSTNGWERLHARSLDVALVSPGEPTAFPTVKGGPDMAQGMSFNLANNVWGTNYVMWAPWGEDDVSMTFRFALEVEDAGGEAPSAAGGAAAAAGGAAGVAGGGALLGGGRRRAEPRHFWAPLTAGLERLPRPQ